MTDPRHEILAIFLRRVLCSVSDLQGRCFGAIVHRFHVSKEVPSFSLYIGYMFVCTFALIFVLYIFLVHN